MTNSRYFLVDVEASLAVFVQNFYFKPRHDIFLTLTSWFSCLNLLRNTVLSQHTTGNTLFAEVNIDNIHFVIGLFHLLCKSATTPTHKESTFMYLIHAVMRPWFFPPTDKECITHKMIQCFIFYLFFLYTYWVFCPQEECLKKKKKKIERPGVHLLKGFPSKRCPTHQFMRVWGLSEQLWTAGPQRPSTPLSPAGCWLEPASESCRPASALSSQSPAGSEAAGAGRALPWDGECRRASWAGCRHRWPPASRRSSWRPAPRLGSAWSVLRLLSAFQPAGSRKYQDKYWGTYRKLTKKAPRIQIVSFIDVQKTLGRHCSWTAGQHQQCRNFFFNQELSALEVRPQTCGLYILRTFKLVSSNEPQANYSSTS